MSRHPITGTCRDTATGQVRGSSTVAVYLAGTTTPASIYAAASGGTAVNSVTSDSLGKYSFYIDEVDYAITQLFKIITSKTWYDDVTYDNLPFFSLQCIDTDNTLAGNSDKKIATQKAVKGYVDTLIPSAPVLKSLYDANTILSANTDNTPAALTIAEQRIVGRKTSGSIDDLTTSEVLDFVPSVTEGDILIRGASVWERFSFTGAVLPFTKSTAPDGWIVCNGSAYSRTTYANLFAVIGTTFGAGDGSTTFNVPDLRNKVAVGSGSTYALAVTDGEATHTLIEGEMPSHSHVIAIGGNQTLTMVGGGSSGFASSITGTAGSGSAHNNMQPFVALNYIIKY